MFGSLAPSGGLNNANNDVVLGQPPEQTVASLHFGPPGSTQSLLLATSWSKEAVIWEVAPTGQNAMKAKVAANAPLLASAFAAPNDATRVFLGSCDGSVHQWNLATNSLSTIGQHAAGVKEVFFSADLNLLITGSWDRTVKYWDTRQPNPAMSVPVSDRVYAMDVKGAIAVVATAEKKITIFDLRKASTPYRAPFESPLKSQSRSLALFPDSSGFAIGSIEGRVGIQHIMDKDAAKNFAFKCHRDPTTPDVYAVNAIAFHQQFGTFATAGSDGTFVFWDKDSKQRLKLFSKVNNAITAVAFSATGVLFAYGVGYDWSKGLEHYDRLKQPNAVLLHALKEEEIKKKK